MWLRVQDSSIGFQLHIEAADKCKFRALGPKAWGYMDETRENSTLVVRTLRTRHLCLGLDFILTEGPSMK